MSTNEGLNRDHITWLEYALTRRAQSATSWRLVNGNAPQESALSESEKADARAFLQEILRILPLVGLHRLSGAVGGRAAPRDESCGKHGRHGPVALHRRGE